MVQNQPFHGQGWPRAIFIFLSVMFWQTHLDTTSHRRAIIIFLAKNWVCLSCKPLATRQKLTQITNPRLYHHTNSQAFQLISMSRKCGHMLSSWARRLETTTQTRSWPVLQLSTRRRNRRRRKISGRKTTTTTRVHFRSLNGRYLLDARPMKTPPATLFHINECSRHVHASRSNSQIMSNCNISYRSPMFVALSG